MPAYFRQVSKFLVNERAVQKNPTVIAEQAAWRCACVRPACSRQDEMATSCCAASEAPK